jgi:Asp-tRNA(Asn)/Glu-tRNA(Gln) amidotransferase C subunit
MTINIKKYAQISYIAVNEIEKEDIAKGVLDILNYVNILKSITIEKKNEREIILSDPQYRVPEAKIENDEETKNIMSKNAPQRIKNYFIVPDLIIRKS